MNHSPEPWTFDSTKISTRADGVTHWILDSEGSIVCDNEANYPTEVTPDDQARIVACVNACAGMDDPAETIGKLRAERDELLAALKELRGWYLEVAGVPAVAANAAIAKAEPPDTKHLPL